MGLMIKRCNEEYVNTQRNELQKKSSGGSFGEKLTRNVLIASLALCCIVSARNIHVSQDKNVLRVLQTAVESEWDDNLGRLVYANSTLSEAISVFANSSSSALYQPCLSQVADVFTSDAPYITYHAADSVYTAAACEITSVSYHPETQTYSLRAHCENGLDCLYSGLTSCFAAEGDPLPARAQIGICKDQKLIFEVRRNGASVDASEYFVSEQVQ
ncbi:MAG: hypothetical protein IKW00_06605 [Clostridia bacterium]|nr:hypothetical protein [Clostridia bacterium]